MKKLLSLILVSVMLLAMLAVMTPAYNSSYSFDFEEMETGFALMTPWNDGANPFRNTWTPYDATNLNSSSVIEENGNKYGQWNGFIQIPYDVVINEPYVFSVDFKGTSAQKSGFFLRSSANDKKSSPSDAELGWCGDDGAGDGYTGSTGIFAWPKNDGTSNKVVIGIKTYLGTDDTHWVDNLIYEADAPAGVNLNDFNTWKFSDDNVKLITISVGGSTVCTIEYSGLNTFDGFTDSYYANAVIKDASGKEVGSTDKALICEKSQLAFFTRSATLNMDNLAFEDYVAGGEEVTGDFALVDVTMLSGKNQMDYTLNDEGGVDFYFEQNEDPYITLLISSQINIKAENYPYFAMYLKTNDYTPGEMFYVTSECGVSDYTGGYSIPLDYQYVEGNQVVVADFSDCGDWYGNVIKLRYDAFSGGPEDSETSAVSLYAAGFFKTYEAAYAFAAEGVSVVTDAECDKLDPPAADTTAAPETQAPVTEAPQTAPATTEAGSVASASTASVTTDGKTEPKTEGNTWIFYVIGGVVAVAAAITATILVKRKK